MFTFALIQTCNIMKRRMVITKIMGIFYRCCALCCCSIWWNWSKTWWRRNRRHPSTLRTKRRSWMSSMMISKDSATATQPNPLLKVG